MRAVESLGTPSGGISVTLDEELRSALLSKDAWSDTTADVLCKTELLARTVDMVSVDELRR